MDMEVVNFDDEESVYEHMITTDNIQGECVWAITFTIIVLSKISTYINYVIVLLIVQNESAILLFFYS